ncbi:hypothetical protein IF129_21470 [Streptomyces chumphonensis]|uniref:Uncharacterized protein n=1 Tax=Streptomyces chumphonensis TaxID=1214925 RepID=A0A927F4C5_9ACTN|nr:hypothetical protein [Streptomyces chumphonensis]MBD3934117.1 hypothetical protein [Streptomyces chumphonensis]
MNREMRDPNVPWVPLLGVQLRLAGVYFDAVRVRGPQGRHIALRFAELTGGDPGPVILERDGERAVYFLIAPGSEARRRWPAGAELLTSGGTSRDPRSSYVGVPALAGGTWPLSWHTPPSPDGRMVHTALLHAVLWAVHRAGAGVAGRCGRDVPRARDRAREGAGEPGD